MNLIAQPARRITCQRDSPCRKTTRPCPDLGDRQCQSAAQRNSPAAAGLFRSHHALNAIFSLWSWLAAPSGRDRPSARLSANHRAGRLARPTASGL